MTKIEEGATFRIYKMNYQCLTSLTIQIPFFVGLISFDSWSWFETTLCSTFQVRKNLLKRIITIIKRGSVRPSINNISDILGLHVWSLLVYGPIWPIFQMERTAQWVFKYYSLYQIQPVQPKIQKICNKKKDLWCTCHNKGIPSCSMIFKLPVRPMAQMDGNAQAISISSIIPCVVEVQIWPMVQKERTVQELSRYSHIFLCGKHTDTTYGSYGKSSMQELFRSSYMYLCGKHTNTTNV